MRFVFALLLSCVGASAQVIVAESIAGEAGSTASNVLTWGQTFTPTTGGTLQSISFNAQRGGNPAPASVTVKLYSVAAEAPTTAGQFSAAFISNLMATTSVSTASLVTPDAFFWVDANFASAAFSLEAGHLYSFVLTYPIPNSELLFFRTNGGYAGGDMIYSSAPETAFAVHTTGTDLAFRVSVIPEPATYAGILGLTVLTVAWRKRRRV